MDKVFRVELSGGNRRYCELDLPATDYELLDALERLQRKPGDKPEWEIVEHTGFQFLHVHLTGECDLYQLNALATRLGQMTSSDRIAFEGLFNMEVAKKYGPISIATMVDLAYSTDCCHVVEGVTTDAQLGEFYAENGFMPELDDLPDGVFDLLDFDKLGEKMRLEDGGILVNRGYVSPHADLKQVYDTLTLEPKQPDYAFRLLIGRYPFETNDQPDKLVPLTLPATSDELADALNACGAASWDEVVFQAEDNAVPHILEKLDSDGIEEINELAQAIQYRAKRSELTKLKAVLHASDCHSIHAATYIAENLDDYLYEPDQRTAEEVAMEELRFVVDEQSLATLQKHVNLFNYGMDVIRESNAMMTPYGLTLRRDGEMLLSLDETPSKGGMQMQ
ncbi:antirestriction protein ArdA [Allofournierella massiliensis]|uniref:antirestriction protein ArdA n=1 Tax=Allofournierella massiliensis TaxID=1650663 RepID=UPI0039A3F3A2